MKKIVLALMVCFMFAGAGFCSPVHKSHPAHKINNSAHVVRRAAPPPRVDRHFAHRRHHHHPHRVYTYYNGYPYATGISVRANGVTFNYGIGGGTGFGTFW